MTALLEISAVVLIVIFADSLRDGVFATLPWLGLGILMLALIKPFAVVHGRVIAGEFVPRPATVTFQAAAATM